MIPVKMTSSTVTCGGQRELPKPSGFVLQLLQLSPWLCLRVWFSCRRRGGVSGDQKVVQGGRRWCPKFKVVGDGLIAPLIGFKLLILCDCITVKKSMLALNLRAFFILVPDFQFMLFNPQLTIKLSIVFN